MQQLSESDLQNVSGGGVSVAGVVGFVGGGVSGAILGGLAFGPPGAIAGFWLGGLGGGAGLDYTCDEIDKAISGSGGGTGSGGPDVVVREG